MLTCRVAIATTLEVRVLPAEIIERYDRRSTLLCYPEGEADDDVSAAVASWHRDLLTVDHDWSIGLPEFIDELYEGDRTVGVAIELLPPLDRNGAPMPRALDAQMLADAETLVAAAAEFTRDNDVELAFELDGLAVGWIERGVADRQLVEGLLRPWRERVGAA
jgi:hypothetical protein